MIKHIAVIGAGIFGVTVAVILSKNGFSVDLFEQENDIFTHATGINQYRLHKGYHYPRSSETIESCKRGAVQFEKYFTNSVLVDNVDSYYCVAKEGSKIDGDSCKNVYYKSDLKFREFDPKIVDCDKISFSAKVNESLFNIKLLKKRCWLDLDKYKVNVKLNTKAKLNVLHDYDLIVVATYVDINSWLVNHLLAQRDYQFEVCEKLILKLPNEYKNKSVVIIDGAFMCIDPYGDTGYHAMGNVVHAIHQTVIGKSIDVSKIFRPLLNKGIIIDPPFTNYNKFIASAIEYFPHICSAIHIGSMYTIRTVLPYHEDDDARPTIVEQISDNLITVFSGKIPTCIDAGNQVLDIIRNIK